MEKTYGAIGLGRPENWTSIVISKEITLLITDRQAEGGGGLEIAIYAGHPKWMAANCLMSNRSLRKYMVKERNKRASKQGDRPLLLEVRVFA